MNITIINSNLKLCFLRQRARDQGDQGTRYSNLGYTIVLILDGNSEIGAHVWSNFAYSTCLWHLFRSIVVTSLIVLLQKRPDFFHTFALFFELPCIRLCIIPLPPMTHTFIVVIDYVGRLTQIEITDSERYCAYEHLK